MGAAQSADEKSLHEFTVKDSKGNEVNLRSYEGKILLVVNVASKCGFTEQNYTQLAELHNRYKDKDKFNELEIEGNSCSRVFSGFEILAFPCNQFFRQEPATSQEVQEFACDRFKVEFPIFQKVCVNGQETAPLYKYLKARKTGFLGSRIKWNFTKFLVDKEGRVISRYGTATPPLSIEEDIQKALGMA